MYIVIYLLFIVLKCSLGARILYVCSIPSYSHQLFHSIIAKELSLRGHEVVQFTVRPLINNELKNLTEVDISFLFNYLKGTDIENSYKYFRTTVLFIKEQIFMKIAEDILSFPPMQKLLNDPKESFDLVIVEWSVTPILSLLSLKFRCPLIGVRPAELRLEGHDYIGNPTNPSYIPIGDSDKKLNNFWGRLDTFIFNILWRIHYYLHVLPLAENTANKYFPEVSESVLSATKNVSLVLVNRHPIINGVRPLVPVIVEIGGLHLNRGESVIPQDIKEFLDSSKHGAVLISLGATTRSSHLNERFVDALIYSFKNSPLNVLWKWDGGPLKNLPDNIRVWKWLPQQKILGHNNTSLFITHGGYLSFQEAIDNQVPVLAVPLFSDHNVNAYRIEYLGVGEVVDYSTITKEKLSGKIFKIINNRRYKENIERISALIKDQPTEPMDKAVWWIEYVLRHRGVPHLRSGAVDMDWIQYLLLDVILFILVCVFGSLLLLRCTFRSFLLLFTSKGRVNCVKKMN